jgi:hypothetical protein
MVASYFNNDTINRTVPIAQQYWNSTTDYNRPISTDSQDIGTSVVNNTTGVSFNFTPRSLVGGGSSGPVYFNAQISYETIKTHIDNSYPIIASIYSDLTGGIHANVVKGYREENGNKYVIVNDPWNGNEYTIDFNDFTTVSYTTFYTEVCRQNQQMRLNRIIHLKQQVIRNLPEIFHKRGCRLLLVFNRLKLYIYI